jgi:hypothetical protein
MTLLPLERPGEWLEDMFLLTLLVESGMNAVFLASTAGYYSSGTQVHKRQESPDPDMAYC